MDKPSVTNVLWTILTELFPDMPTEMVQNVTLELSKDSPPKLYITQIASVADNVLDEVLPNIQEVLSESHYEIVLQKKNLENID